MNEWTTSGRKLKLVQGNIALFEGEALVNAANKSLILGGGVSGAIRTYGGPSIQDECNKIGPIEVGEAVITGAGNLKAKYVIHAAGPVYGEGNEDLKLNKAVLNSLRLATKKRIKTVAFPAISTGIFRFPIQRCSEIMLKAAMEYLKSNSLPTEVTICLYDEKAYSVFMNTLEKIKCADSSA